LACGDKSGGSEKRFYRQLIEKADIRFGTHLAGIKRGKEKQRQKEGAGTNENFGSED
jgi:hypothetical protein